MEASGIFNSLGPFALKHGPLSMAGTAKIFQFHDQLTGDITAVRIVACNAGKGMEIFFLLNIDCFVLAPGRKSFGRMTAIAVGRGPAVVDYTADGLAVTGGQPHVVA